MTSNPVLVGLALRDGDAAALALGRELASFLRAPLAAAHVVSRDSSTLLSAPADAAARKGETLIAMANAVGLLDDELDVMLHVEFDPSPVRGLRRAALHLDAALLVVSASHRGAAGLILPGGVGERLIPAAPCALAFAPHGYRGAPDGVRRIGAAFAHTPESTQARDAATALAALGDAELSVITVPLTKSAGDAIAPASADLDLLVCGSRGFRPLAGAVAGAVSVTLAHSSACPLIVLPRETHASTQREVARS